VDVVQGGDDDYFYGRFCAVNVAVVVRYSSCRCDGATENARHENTGRSKMQDLKMRDMNLRHHVSGVENAGHENAAPILQGWKMREKLVWKAKV